VSRLPRGARGQGATDVLPHDARQGGRPLRRSSLASGGVCARHVAEAEVHGYVLAKDRAGEGPPWTEQVSPIHLGEFRASTPDPNSGHAFTIHGISRPFFRNVESSHAAGTSAIEKISSDILTPPKVHLAVSM